MLRKYHIPLCFAMEEQFDREIGRSSPVATIQESLEKDRLCDSFTDWHQGFTPKEHMEMNLLEKQRLLHQKLEEENRKWREEQAEKERLWREDQDGKQKKWHDDEVRHRRMELAVTIVGVILLSITAQIASAFIQRGSLFPDRPPAASQPLNSSHTMNPPQK
jgi:hypothetical protein